MTQDSQSVRHALRARVAAADRQRRGRAVATRVWRAAPLAAFVCLLAAVAGRLLGWAPVVALILLLLSLGSLALAAALARRPREISDAEAAAIDTQAGLQGELRSAHWFARAAEHEGDAWIDFHVARAATRVDAVDWDGIYPAPRSPRAKAATGVLAVTALIIAVGLPGRADTSSSAGRAGQTAATPGALPLTAADLLKRIDDLLVTIETGKGRALTAEEVRGLLAALDKVQADRNAAKPNVNDADKKGAKPLSEADLKALAERSKRASESSELQPEVRDALADMSNKLAEQTTAQNAAPKDPRDAANAEENPSGETAQAQSGGGKQDPSGQSVKEAAAGGGIGIVMMAGDSSSAKEAGLGLGGASGTNANNGQMPNLAALRKETIESAKDDEGDKTVLGERRQTERGTATAAYAHTAPAAAGRGRSTAPPPVPESRRAALRSYFIRKQ